MLAEVSNLAFVDLTLSALYGQRLVEVSAFKVLNLLTLLVMCGDGFVVLSAYLGPS